MARLLSHWHSHLFYLMMSDWSCLKVCLCGWSTLRTRFVKSFACLLNTEGDSSGTRTQHIQFEKPHGYWNIYLEWPVFLLWWHKLLKEEYGSTVHGALLRLEAFIRYLIFVDEGIALPYLCGRWRHVTLSLWKRGPINFMEEGIALSYLCGRWRRVTLSLWKWASRYFVFVEDGVLICIFKSLVYAVCIKWCTDVLFMYVH